MSLTYVSCKLLENVVCRHIRDHLDAHRILSPLQHRCCRGNSCDSQLLVTLRDLMSMFHHKLKVDLAVLYFSKAFYTVLHDKLLNKLEHYGIHSHIHLWISNFLKHRQQCVLIDGISSDHKLVESGVPQGRVMGPLRFPLCINNLPKNVSSQVHLFADDCLVYRSCPHQLRQLAYFSLVRSKLAAQHRAAQFVMGDHRRRSSVTAMLQTLAGTASKTDVRTRGSSP